MPLCPGVILAGGLSRRMSGRDKPLLALAGRPMLAHVIARLAPQAAPLALSANGDVTRFAVFQLPVIRDPVAGYPGPLAGVLAGLEWAERQGATAIITAAADTPFLPSDLAEVLGRAAALAPSGLAIAATRGADGSLHRHPTFGRWPVSLRGELAAALANGVHKVAAFADACGAAPALFPDANAFFNVNTPDDLAEAEARLARTG